MDRQPSFWAKVARGEWEPHTMGGIIEEVGPGTLFLDVGAWVGATAMLAAARGGQVVALEPDPAAHEQLLANVSANPGLAPRIQVIPRALSRGAGPVRMGYRRQAGDSMSSVLLGNGKGSWTAMGVTVDEIEALLPPCAPLLVKMDIEGAEYDVVGEIVRLGRGRPLTIMLSLHPALLMQARGEHALLRATLDMKATFAGFVAERAQVGRWFPMPCFDPLGGLLEASEWRLRNRGRS
jgi:FkbM family methyltransferase